MGIVGTLQICSRWCIVQTSLNSLSKNTKHSQLSESSEWIMWTRIRASIEFDFMHRLPYPAARQLLFCWSFAYHWVHSVNGSLHFLPYGLVYHLLPLYGPLPFELFRHHLDRYVGSVGIIISAQDFHVTSLKCGANLILTCAYDGSLRLAPIAVGAHRFGNGRGPRIPRQSRERGREPSYPSCSARDRSRYEGLGRGCQHDCQE